MPEEHDISWMPAWVGRAEIARFAIGHRSAGRALVCARPTREGWRAVGEGLRRAQRALAEMPLREIVAAIATVAGRWTDPTFAPRVRAREDVVATTGFSAEAVDRSFDVELRNYTAEALERTLRRELGSPEVLDGFRDDAELGGRGFAIGPRITIALMTGNVPGLPALSVVRALLVKSAVIAKVASGEPTFAARFVRTLHDVEPRLGDAIVVTYWDRADEASLDAALDLADAVIAYGGEEACASVRSRVRPHQRYVEHGHKLSLGIVSRRYLTERGSEEVARRIAEDVSTFNQHACIAPQAYLVEGDVPSVRGFASSVAKAMAAYAERCPLGSLDEEDAASLQLRRAADAWHAAARPECDLWHAAGFDWTVTLSDHLAGITGAGNRVLRIVPVRDLRDAVARLDPLAAYLQNVGLGATGDELSTIAVALARKGACRICEPGRMAAPSMMWRHDGVPCVAALLRWCDIEMHGELGAS
jgi:acyl-CoA reductase LuxC